MCEKPVTCIKCGAGLKQPRTGRSRVYCSPGCRQSAAHEIQRLNRRLLDLEVQLSSLRQQPDMGFSDFYGRNHQAQIAGVQAEITEAEGRLRLLLAEPRGVN